VTSTDNDQVPAAADDYLPKADVLTGNSLARALLAMVQRHDLIQELAVARYQAERATTALADLTHDLATPLGVVMGTTDALLSEDNGLNAEGRSYLEDVAREALRACAILRQVNLSEASPGPALQAPVVSRPISAGPGSKTVLVADDDAGTRRLVAATLDSDQYSVLEAADGKEAWRLIREHHPAVAILDWQMPIYSGLELTDVIKGDPRFRDMTVILLTGRSTQADREAGARAHADLYLIKPFLPHELLAGVEQALRVS
jgi:CheY-like chemotaxis protein